MKPCERFTVLEWRKTENAQCDVCDHLEADHNNPGRRTLSGGEIEELRRRMIVENHDKFEEDRRSSDGSA